MSVSQLQPAGTGGPEHVVAWGKLLGTMTASVSQYLYGPGTVLWLVIYVEIRIVDLVYVSLLSKAPQYQRDEVGAAAAPLH